MAARAARIENDRMTTATATKERTLNLTAEEVRAVLDGRKTQCRKPLPDWAQVKYPVDVEVHPNGYASLRSKEKYTRENRTPENPIGSPVQGVGLPCPYGGPSDRLWVRETALRSGESILYEGDEDYDICYPTRGGKMNLWRVMPSIHMPRWASRITLEITGVRVERVQDISDDDIQSEGTPQPSIVGQFVDDAAYHGQMRNNFKALWDSINGKTHPWASNCWVWVIEFKRTDA